MRQIGAIELGGQVDIQLELWLGARRPHKDTAEVAQIEIPRGARSIRLSGSRLLVGDRRGVTMFDVSDPSAPRRVNRTETPASADGLSISDSSVYVANREGGLIILGM